MGLIKMKPRIRCSSLPRIFLCNGSITLNSIVTPRDGDEERHPPARQDLQHVCRQEEHVDHEQGDPLPADGGCWYYNQSVANTAPRFGGYLDGGTWGVINEVGNWPGAWWPTRWWRLRGASSRGTSD